MLTRLSSSLTLRIFLMTGALMLAACVVTYGAIAYLTPISYTSLLADELSRETDALLARLGASTADACEGILQAFARNTGTDICLTDEYGQVLYDTIHTTQISGIASTSTYDENITTVLEDAGAQAEESRVQQLDQDGRPSSGSELSQGTLEQVIIMQNDVLSEGEHFFTFSDGTSATLIVQGGHRAVNQAAEAMKQTLPFLLLLIAGICALGSFFYARFITKPIVSISHIARQIADLDFGARWHKRRSDEIGALGESLNLLSDNLSEALSSLKTANESLQRNMDRERELDLQRLAFFSAASHELKTPVTILKGQLSGMLAQIGVYRDREKYLARSLEVTGRMEGLIQEILTISRIESGSFSLGTASIDLGNLMERQLALDEELIERKALSLDCELAPGVLVCGNESLLSNALDNVLMNAILYSPPGASVIVRVQPDGFRVENTGVFLPEEALAQLFTPFYRVESSRNRKSGGSGLGLYLVKSILSLHGASCGMHNTEKGVCFTARFAKPTAQ